MSIDLEKARARLAALAADLDRQDETAGDGHAPVALDQQSVGRLSRMDAMQHQALAQAQRRKRAAARVRIDQAYRRIADGEYGYCEACGEEIPDRRLAIDPTASRCTGCM